MRISDTSRRRCNQIGAAPRSRQNMIYPFDADLAAEQVAKQRQLLAAEPLAYRGCRADRAMILGEQDRAVAPPHTFGHIALLSPNLGQHLHPAEQSGSRQLHPFGVTLLLALRALVEQALQPAFTECRAHGADHFE